ncbi:MAG: hypothetical protein M5R36_09805 [Deltaproteobacteria bacterium]|nr:hypothetical protein [Deltaproteobacteria bacterium]
MEAGARVVNLSLDGPPPIHNLVRGSRDAYRLAREALDNLAANAPGLPVNIVTVVMGANMALLPAFLDELDADARVNGVYLQIATNPRGPRRSGRLAARSRPLASGRGRPARRFRRSRRAQRSRREDPEPPTRCAGRRVSGRPGVSDGGICRVYDFGFCIDPRGDVSLCGLFAPAGNIAREDLGAILDGAGFAATSEAMRACELGCHRQINCASALEPTIPTSPFE